jgi:hypothetical protein
MFMLKGFPALIVWLENESACLLTVSHTNLIFRKEPFLSVRYHRELTHLPLKNWTKL